MRQKIGQQLFVGIQGTSLSPEESSFIAKNNIGGVILFARNCESPQQLHTLCCEIQEQRNNTPEKIPFFIGIDMEGGRVHRLKPPFTQWPALAEVGKLDSTSVAFKFAMNMGQELTAIGINLNFAPTVDILTNPKNTVIGDRAIGNEEGLVSRISSALVRGYIKSGIIPCAKHFPGHGNTIVDSHDDLPKESATLDDLKKREILPFKKVFRARLDFVLMAHILFEKVDPQWPASLSEEFIKKTLRDDFRYRNLIIPDDLDMGALRKNYSVEEVAVQALVAGNNMLLYCNDSESPPKALASIEKAIEDKKLDAAVIEENYQKIVQIKKVKLTQATPLDMKEASRIIGHPDHLKLAKAISQGEVPEEMMAT